MFLLECSGRSIGCDWDLRCTYSLFFISTSILSSCIDQVRFLLVKTESISFFSRRLFFWVEPASSPPSREMQWIFTYKQLHGPPKVLFDQNYLEIHLQVRFSLVSKSLFIRSNLFKGTKFFGKEKPRSTIGSCRSLWKSRWRSSKKNRLVSFSSVTLLLQYIVDQISWLMHLLEL